MKTTALSIKKSIFTSVLFAIFICYTSLYSQIRIIKVDPFTDEVTIQNFGGSMVNISSYHFCTQRTYAALNIATIINGSLNLGAGADVTLIVNTASGLSTVSSDLSIYHTPSFGVATNMVDFMQYGASFPGLAGRENEAVSQGLWAAGTFIGGEPSVYFYNGNGTENGVGQWGTTLGLNDEFLSASLSVYPNPANTFLNIKKLQNINLNKAVIYDITGRLLSAIDLRETISEKIIQLDKISKGIYFIRISDDQGGIVAKRFIKE